MIGGESIEGEDAQIAFQRIVNELLDLKLKSDDIYPVYDYFHNSLDKINYVFYAEVKTHPIFDSFKKGTLSWVSFNDTLKFPFSDHTKQDIVVSERVINLKRRLDQNLQ